MIDLIEFFFNHYDEKKHKYYKKHIEDISYYSDFGVFILDEELCKNKIEENYFQVVDCKDAIEEFKYLIQPTKDYREKYKNVKFILLCFYLHNNDYVITEFPNVLEQTIDRGILAYDKIRAAIGGSPVAWADRRKFIEGMHFKRDINRIQNIELDELIEEISTSSLPFESMSTDEKLAVLNNTIEHLLKENGKYINLDEKLFLGLINNESLKQYRKKTQIFRHATKEAIAERSKIDDIQKEFLVNFGRTVCITIFQYLQEN